jgi:hypothetical protein
MHAQRGIGADPAFQLGAHRAIADQRQLQFWPLRPQRCHRIEQFAQAFFGHQTTDVDHQFGVGIDTQRGAGVGARLGMEDPRIAAVGYRADACGVGVVIARRDPAQVFADDQNSLRGVQDRAGEALADGIAHAQVRAARADHQRQARAPRGVHRAEGIGIQPIRQHHIRRERAQRRVQGARAQPAVERATDHRQRRIIDVAHVAAGHRMFRIGRVEQIAARLGPARIAGDRAEHAHFGELREFAYGLMDRPPAVGLAGDRELRGDDENAHALRRHAPKVMSRPLRTPTFGVHPSTSRAAAVSKLVSGRSECTR